MSVYFIANIRINDNNEYGLYLKDTEKVFSRFKGKYLAVDEKPILLEGKWNYTRIVIISFPDKESFKEWYYSDEYQGILKHRLNSAECDTVLAEGL